jgi:hypothetical protein
MKKFKINLQLFAEPTQPQEDINELLKAFDGMNGNSDDNQEPLDTQEPPSGTTLESEEMNLEGGENEPPSGTTQEPSTQAEPIETNEPPSGTTQELLLGKFKTVEDLEKAYQESQSLLGKQGSELGEYRKMLQNNQLNMGITNIPNQSEDVFEQMDDEDLVNSFLTNPKGFLKGFLELSKGEIVQSTKAERERDEYIQKFFNDNSDINYLKNDFMELFEKTKDPELSLLAVRGKSTGNLDSLLKNESFVSKNFSNDNLKKLFENENILNSIASNLPEKIKNDIIQEYVKTLKETKAPEMLGKNNGSTAKLPPKQYSNFGEAFDDNVSFLKNYNK